MSCGAEGGWGVRVYKKGRKRTHSSSRLSKPAGRSWNATRQTSPKSAGIFLKTMHHFLVQFCWLLFYALTCSSQEPPMDGPTDFKDVNYRTDVCDRQQQLFEGKIELRDALRGLDLSVYITKSTDLTWERVLFSLTEQQTIPKKRPGLVAVLLDELARRAKFSWRNSFVASSDSLETSTSNTNNNNTWTDLLLWSSERFDISANYWIHSNERRALGVSFPEFWYDDSIILISTRSENIELMSFLRPFDSLVWIIIGVSIILTGLLYIFLERFEEQADEGALDSISSIFLSAMTMTGHFKFMVSTRNLYFILVADKTIFPHLFLFIITFFGQPNSHAARVLSFSWSFCALILSSAYTANLVTFLVTPDVPNHKSLENVIRLEKTMCVRKNTQHDTFLTRKYPIFAEPEKGMVLRKNSNDELLKGILDGDCEFGLIEESTFHLYQRTTHNCKLLKVGESIKAIRAGFATKMDSGTFCTSLISYVLDLHLLEMKKDGFFDDAWDRTLDQQGVKKCSSDKKPSFFESEDDTSGDPLEIRDMWGIFVLHAVVSLASLFLTPLCCNLFHKDRREALASYARGEGQISIWRLDFSSPCRSSSPGRDSIWVTTSSQAVQHT